MFPAWIDVAMKFGFANPLKKHIRTKQNFNGHVLWVKARDYAVIQTVIVWRAVPPLPNPSMKIKLVYIFATNSFVIFFWRGGGVSQWQLLLFQAPFLCGLWLPRSKYLDHSLWWLARSIATSGYGWCCRHQCGFSINESLWWQGFWLFCKGRLPARRLLKTGSIL